MGRLFRIVVAGTLLVVVLGVVLLAYGAPLWRYVECERVDETNALGVRRVYFVKRWGRVEGVRHGPYVEYWPNGGKKHATEYVNGIFDNVPHLMAGFDANKDGLLDGDERAFVERVVRYWNGEPAR